MEDFFKFPGRGFTDRIASIKAVIIILVCTIFLRALDLQVFKHEELRGMADARSKKNVQENIQRGRIIDSDGKTIAVSIPRPSVFAHPEKIEDPERTALVLSVGLDEKFEAADFKDRSGFMWVKRHITYEQKKFIEKQNLPGVYFDEEFARVYPKSSFAAQLVGIVGLDSKGLDGLEYRFDDYLMGKFSDGPLSKDFETLLRGADVHLTISEKIQYFTEKALRKSVLATHSKNGIAIVMESRTGAILAMASYPAFDPNNFGDFDQKLYANRSVSNAYEPGSTFKIITLSIARQNELIKPTSEVFCEDGSYKVMDRFITDVNPYGVLSLKEIIQKSSNICSLKIGLSIPKQTFFEEIMNFGFGQKTGIDLPGESDGVLHDFRSWSKIDQAAISFGHSLQVTPIQLISAINTVANQGVYLSPYIVQNISIPGGENLYQRKQVQRKVLDPQIAKEITEYMVAVTEKGGTGYVANIPGLSIAGKTGTTKKLSPNGKGYSSQHHIRSFVGFLPSEAPVLTILTILNEPREKYEDSLTAAPLFKEIALNSYRYFIKSSSQEYIPPTDAKNFIEQLFPKAEKANDLNNIKGRSLRELLYYSSISKKQVSVEGKGSVKSVKTSGTNLEVKLD